MISLDFLFKVMIFVNLAHEITVQLWVLLFGVLYVYMKDLCLVKTINLINLHVKSAALFMKSAVLSTFHWKALCLSLFTVVFTRKQCTFHFSLHFSLKSSALLTEKQCTSHWKAVCFSLFAMLFTEKHCTFHFLLCFSLKSTVLFTFHCAFQ